MPYSPVLYSISYSVPVCQTVLRENEKIQHVWALERIGSSDQLTYIEN